MSNVITADIMLQGVNSMFIPDALPAQFQREHVIDDNNRTSFESVLQSAMEVLGETNRLQVESDIAQVNLATGRSNDVLEVVMAQARADSSLNFTVQVTNRIVEAYREIMRMQL